jgi:hypothetical protein
MKGGKTLVESVVEQDETELSDEKAQKIWKELCKKDKNENRTSWRDGPIVFTGAAEMVTVLFVMGTQRIMDRQIYTVELTPVKK